MRRWQRSSARFLLPFAMSAFACGLLAVSAQAAAPTIEGVSTKSVAPRQATLEAKIDPNGLETTYEFLASYAVCQNAPDECLVIAADKRWGEGHILAGSSPQTVSVTVADLSPGYFYTYEVVATNSAGTTQSVIETFTTTTEPPPAEPSPPAIESLSLSHLTSTDGTLEGQIDTEGLETAYRFELWASPCAPYCELIEDIPLPSGKLLGSFVKQNVSLDLNSAGVTLIPGGEYGYSVSATSSAGSVEGKWQKFIAPEPVIVPPENTTTTGDVPSLESGLQAPDYQAPDLSQTSSTSAPVPLTSQVPRGKTSVKGRSKAKHPAKPKKNKRHKSTEAKHKRRKAHSG